MKKTTLERFSIKKKNIATQLLAVATNTTIGIKE